VQTEQLRMQRRLCPASHTSQAVCKAVRGVAQAVRPRSRKGFGVVTLHRCKERQGHPLVDEGGDAVPLDAQGHGLVVAHARAAGRGILEARARADQQGRGESIGVGRAQGERGAAAHRVAEEMRVRYIECIESGNDLGDATLHRVVRDIVRRFAGPVSDEVDADHAVRVAQSTGQAGHAARRSREAVKKHDGMPTPFALDVELDAVRHHGVLSRRHRGSCVRSAVLTAAEISRWCVTLRSRSTGT